MTANVNQASTLAANPPPGGMRHHRQGGGHGFADALDATARHADQAPGRVQPKTGAATSHDREHGRARTDSNPGTVDLNEAAGAVRMAQHRTTVTRGGATAADEAERQVADSRRERPDKKAGDELPSQLKAEQAISALMAMAPVERRAAGALAGSSKSDGTTAQPDGGAGNGAGLAEAMAADLIAGRQSSADPKAGPPKAAGGGGSRAIHPGTVAEAPAASAATIDPESATSSPARNAKVKGDGNDGTGRKAGVPSSADTSDPQPADAASRPRPVASAKDGDAHPDPLGKEGGDKAAPEARRVEPQPAAAKVTVLSQQAAPAPAAPPLSANATAVVTAVAGEQSWRFTSTASSESALAFRTAQPMRSLKIELHPAELGTVTANLKASGSQLSVELKVENHEAYARLSADSDAIVQSLRSLGYDIDRVSIQQPQAAATVVAGSDPSAGTGSFSRDPSSLQSGNPGSGSERFGGRANGQGSRNDGQHHDEPREIVRDRTGGSLYI
jgi:chemotaxis protein MotD